MSYLLGIFCKSGTLAECNFEPVLKAFSLEGTRPLLSAVTDKYAVFTHRCCFLSGNKSQSLAIAGNAGIEGVRWHNGAAIGNEQLQIFSEKLNQDTGLFLRNIQGAFTLAWYNGAQHVLRLANDSLGLYPIYLAETDQCVFFCTETEPLTKIAGMDLTIDLSAVSEYFELGSVLASKTFFRNIHNLEPGTLVSFSGNGKETIKYDSGEIKVEHSRTVESFAEEAAFLLKQSVNRMITADSPCNVMLTGGVDTRLILGCIAPELRKTIPFVTYLTPPLTASEDQEVIVAKAITKDLGLIHTLENFPFLGRDFGPWFYEQQRAPEGPPLVAGLFGSEILKGEFVFSMPRVVLQRLQRQWKMEIPARLMQPDSPRSVWKSLKGKTPGFLNSEGMNNIADPNKTLVSYLDSLRVENNELLFAIQSFLRSFFTNNWGQSTYSIPFIRPSVVMTHTILPFTDAAFIRFLLRVPPRLLGIQSGQLYNTLYKNHFPELCKYPTNSALGRVEGNCIPPMREGLSPHEYRKVNYRSTFNSMMSGTHGRDRSLYNKPALLKLAKDPETAWLKKFVEFESWMEYITKV